MDQVDSYLLEVQEALIAAPRQALRDVIGVLNDARLKRKQIVVMGNGGSAATASHFACDLGKGAQVDGCPRLRVLALTDNMATFSAYANDEGYDWAFAKQLEGLVGPGDVVVGISGSGKSPNVLNAIEFARSCGATTVGFVGFDGGSLKGMVDLAVHVERGCMEQVEDMHVVFAHLVATALRRIAEGAAVAGAASDSAEA